jgi:hypothetical protein
MQHHTKDTALRNEQHGPQHAADTLEQLVSEVTYKDGWNFDLAYINRPTEHFAGSQGLTLIISAEVPNSIRPGETTNVEHWMAVPPTSWGRASWMRWILDQIILVETHEAMEFYRVNGRAPYFPSHGPGHDPYAIELNQDDTEASEG